MHGGGQPYRIRVLKDYQIMDGCCDEGDTIDFRMALRGACAQYLCPTVKNIYNKFSVRFFIRVVFSVRVRYRIAKDSKKAESNNDGASSEEFENVQAVDGNSDDEGNDAYSESTEVSSNFLEVGLWR